MSLCKECGAVMVGKGCGVCGWSITANAKQKEFSAPHTIGLTPEEQQLHIQRAIKTFGELYTDAKEIVAVFKKEHGDGWQREFITYIKQETAGAIRKQEQIRLAEHARKQAIREQFPKTEMTEIVNDVFTSMPAPHDQEGIKRYNQKLQEVQEFIPGHE